MSQGGDALARGAVRAQFETPNVSQEKWEKTFEVTDKRRLNVMSDEDRSKAETIVSSVPEEVQQPEFKIRAIQDRIIVRRVEEEEKVGTFFVPDESKEKPAEGIVVAVGPGKVVNGDLQPISVAVGERVVFGKYAGAEVKIGFEKLLVLREEDLFLVKL